MVADREVYAMLGRAILHGTRVCMERGVEEASRGETFGYSCFGLLLDRDLVVVHWDRYYPDTVQQMLAAHIVQPQAR